MVVVEFGIVVFAALATVSIGMWWAQRSVADSAHVRPEDDNSMSLLFDSGVLHHATDDALSHFAFEPGVHDWADLHNSILARFPNFPEQAESGEPGRKTLYATDTATHSVLRIAWRDALTWVTLTTPPATQGAGISDETANEIAALRRSSDTCPNPVWQLSKDGEVVWHNTAYALLYEMAHGAAPNAKRPLFDTTTASDSVAKAAQRVFLYANGSEVRDWYELTSVEVDEIFCCQASCINAVVEAEVAQRNFVQTLAKTFAHLSIGLAIFDRNDQLALFNPALLDLTDLRAEFLSARPTILSFFDALRENRRMPEPKNYGNWRQQIAEMISAAADGRYEETWSLETGQTYRVKGRPHPDGATAFLIEDISAEVTLTRNFRAELELGQSLMDKLDDALVVFSASGVLTFCNVAYREMWSLDPDASFADVMVSDSITAWKKQAAPNPMWPDIEDFVLNYGEREAWDMPLYLSDGTALSCHVAPIASGATLVRFRKLPSNRTLPVVMASKSSDWEV